MRNVRNALNPVVTAVVVLCAVSACSGEAQPEPQDTSLSSQSVVAEPAAPAVEQAEAAATGERAGEESGGEHARREGTGEHEGGSASEHAEGGEGRGEEPGIYIGRAETWNRVRNGARLVLAFDAATNRFTGRVENTTAAKLCAVRVEVHLSTGAELGPTPRTDVPAQGSIVVELKSTDAPFESWTAHPEISRCAAG